MKPIQQFILLAALLSSPFAKANMLCEVNEKLGEEHFQKVITVAIQDENPHGSIQNFEFSHYTSFTGMVAYLKGQAVISVADSETGFAFSSVSQLSAGEIAHHQVMLPSTDDTIKAITIDCHLTQNLN